MNELEKLIFQRNIENVKYHVRTALQGHEIYCREGSWCSQWAHCSGCGEETDWGYGEEIKHLDGCEYLKQEQSKKLLLEWSNENDLSA